MSGTDAAQSSHGADRPSKNDIRTLSCWPPLLLKRWRFSSAPRRMIGLFKINTTKKWQAAISPTFLVFSAMSCKARPTVGTPMSSSHLPSSSANGEDQILGDMLSVQRHCKVCMQSSNLDISHYLCTTEWLCGSIYLVQLTRARSWRRETR